MKTCDHSHWLGLSLRNSETTFIQTDRAQTLLHSLPYFESQKPRLFVLVGNSAKALALGELTSAKTLKKSASRRGHGEIHLHIDASTIFSDRPVLFAEGDFPTYQTPSKSIPTDGCHEITLRTLPKLNPGPVQIQQYAADRLYSRLLSPFTDVYCFFAVDLGGLKPIAQRIASWLDNSQPSTLPATTHSEIIIVTEGSEPVLQEPRLLDQFLRLLYAETGRDLSTHFAGVRILTLLPPGAISTQARHRRLKECLMNASDQVRSARMDSGTLFSAHHLAAFLRCACSHFAKSMTEPFDFIRTSRLDNPPAVDLEDHLTNFLLKIKTPQELKNFAVPLISSCLLLDSYPPDMHRFNPSDVFRILYKDNCYKACRNGALTSQDSNYLVLPSGFVKLIEDDFLKRFEILNRSTRNTSLDLHTQTLLRFSLDSLSIRSDGDFTCFTCLRRRPQYNLPCRHCVCENCVRSFGRKNQYNPWLFEVDSCFFCSLTTFGVTVKTLPPTASIRVLTFDGGGVRALSTLEFLRDLQDKIGLPYPVQENFDVVFGTSSGGIIALALFVNGWSVDQCIEYFESLAKVAFQRRPSSNIPVLSQIIDFLISFFADGRYPVENLEEVLQKTFGNDRSILDCSKATAIGTRIGLPVTTIDDASTCIFTNYNGIGSRPADCEYHVLRPKDGLTGIPLWEIARCGSAAPSYFKPRYVSGLGTFQDGGLRHNNPQNLALQEVAAIFPSTVEPSLVVSLGTGSRRMPSNGPRMSVMRGIFRDGFIPRIFRAFIASLKSDAGRRNGPYFRFDVEYDGYEPSLDDTTKMQQLRDYAQSAISESPEADRLVRCVFAECFIFELESDPERGENGQFVCTGHILCRLRANEKALTALLDQLEARSAKFLLYGRPIMAPTSSDSLLDRDGDFCKRVQFQVYDRKSPISIQLQEGQAQPSDISGSPFSIEKLVADQGLAACFGRADHVKRKWVDSTDALSSGRKRRRF